MAGGECAGRFETRANSAMALPARFLTMMEPQGRPDGLRQINTTGKISLFPKGKSPL